MRMFVIVCTFPMISSQFGRQIKDLRESKGLSQAALSDLVSISRAVLSKMERGAGPVQTDVLDRLVSALDTKVVVAVGTRANGDARVEARLRQRLREAELRAFHLRVALQLGVEPRLARPLIARAAQQVALWNERKTCSADYVERWNAALSGTPRDVAAAMASFGEWENAMYQNSPWMFLWN